MSRCRHRPPPPSGVGVLALAALVALIAAGCTRGEGPLSRFERMWHQRRVDPYDPSPLFSDGAAMRPPPAGAVPRAVQPAAAAAADATRGFPFRVTRETLRRGRDRFDIYCSPCHGVAGDGQSPVARFMTLRPPPSLLSDRVRALTPERVATVIDSGYGLMPSYATALAVHDRWAVVAYVEVLQLRDRMALADLPAAVRRRALTQLPAAAAAAAEAP